MFYCWLQVFKITYKKKKNKGWRVGRKLAFWLFQSKKQRRTFFFLGPCNKQRVMTILGVRGVTEPISFFFSDGVYSLGMLNTMLAVELKDKSSNMVFFFRICDFVPEGTSLASGNRLGVNIYTKSVWIKSLLFWISVVSHVDRRGDIESIKKGVRQFAIPP